MSPPEIKAPEITIFFLQESPNYYNLLFSSFNPHLYSSWWTHLASLPPHVQDSPTVPSVCFTYSPLCRVWAPQQDLLSSVVILFRGTCRMALPQCTFGGTGLSHWTCKLFVIPFAAPASFLLSHRLHLLFAQSLRVNTFLPYFTFKVSRLISRERLSHHAAQTPRFMQQLVQ